MAETGPKAASSSLSMRKALWTLNIDGYAPEITAMTYPLLRVYAAKIGAEFRVISERQFPDWPPVYEKLQIHELGREYDWNIYIDSDALVHPDMFDVTDHLTKDTVCHNGNDMAGNRWKYDRYFRRDGRHIGSCNWFTVASDWCLDLWEPLEMTLEEALQNIAPIVVERTLGITSRHLIDDYTLSRNIAKYGLKFETIQHLQHAKNIAGNYLWHIYTVSVPEKVRQMREVLHRWEITRLPEYGMNSTAQPLENFSRGELAGVR